MVVEKHEILRKQARRLLQPILSNKSKNYMFAYKKYSLKKPDLKKKPHRCPACKVLKDTYKALISHLKECHPEYKYRCKYCRKTLTAIRGDTSTNFGMKVSVTSGPDEKCAKLFQFYYQVRDHWKKHSKRKLYTCEIRDCLKGFMTKRALNYHKRSHNLDPNTKQYACDFVINDDRDFCGKRFSRKNLLDQHKRAHNKDYVTHCGKTYAWPNSCKYHQDRCDQCKGIMAKKRKEFKYQPD